MWRILLALARRPYSGIVRRWNWKSAVLSAILRAVVFFSANVGAGVHAALGVAAVDSVFRISTSGFYGTVTQQLRRAEPAWQGAAASLVLLPACNHTLEFLVHWGHGTPRLKASVIASVAFTGISTLFNWFAMRRGALLSAGEGDSLARDLARMPAIIGAFIAAAPLALRRAAASRTVPR